MKLWFVCKKWVGTVAGTVVGTGWALDGHWAGTVRALWVGRWVCAREPRFACEK